MKQTSAGEPLTQLAVNALDAMLPASPGAIDPTVDTPKAARRRDLQALEDGLFEQASDLIRGAMHFADFDPEAWPTEPPPAWVEELGFERANRLLVAAKAGWMSKKEAPVGLDMARSVHASITKARSQDRGEALQMNAIFLTVVPEKYEVIEVESEE
jgi:hypothetical protein